MAVPVRSRVLDRAYVDAAAHGHEAAGFDRVLIPFGSDSPEIQIVAAHAAALTENLAFWLPIAPALPSPRWPRACLPRLTSSRAGG